jgi:hypothetical protein
MCLVGNVRAVGIRNKCFYSEVAKENALTVLTIPYKARDYFLKFSCSDVISFLLHFSDL